MGATAPGGTVNIGGVPQKGRYSRPSKPSPRPTEQGVTSQEAVEFAISYAREQRQKQQRELESRGIRAEKGQQLLGPEEDKHYHRVTRSQPGQLAAGALLTCSVQQLTQGCLLSSALPADSPYADLELVADSWSKCSFTGVRALPEVLEHGFRQRSLCETVLRGKLLSLQLYCRSSSLLLQSNHRLLSNLQCSSFVQP